MLELVIFDADGVLFDSIESNISYYNAIFAAIGEPPLNRVEEVNSISHAADQVYKDRAGSDSLKLEQMRAVARSMDQKPFFRLLRPPLELRPFLQQLSRRYKVGLATNRSATVPGLIEHLDLNDIFHAVASALDRVPPKPAPDILHLCLQRAGIPRERAVYVGDSLVDQVAARAAGIRFIAVGTRIAHECSVASIEELPGVLDRLNAAG